MPSRSLAQQDMTPMPIDILKHQITVSLGCDDWDTPQKMTFLWKFYVIFVPERHFCGVSPDE
jgi:hypothetical protein